jgi:hypothetical protein
MLRVIACLLFAADILSAQAPGSVPNPFGEPARASTPHLSVASTVTYTTAGPGTRLRVTLEVTPRPAMHVYAPGKHDYQVVTFVIDPQPWASLEPTQYPPSEKYYFAPLDETVEVYSKPFRLTRDVRLLETPDARRLLTGLTDVTITGRLEYQACDDKMCYAPTKVPVKLTVAVKK